MMMKNHPTMSAMAMPEMSGSRMEKKPARMMRMAMAVDQPKAGRMDGDRGTGPGVENALMAGLFSANLTESCGVMVDAGRGAAGCKFGGGFVGKSIENRP